MFISPKLRQYQHFYFTFGGLCDIIYAVKECKEKTLGRFFPNLHQAFSQAFENAEKGV